jgi:hypothetical protein
MSLMQLKICRVDHMSVEWTIIPYVVAQDEGLKKTTCQVFIQPCK